MTTERDPEAPDLAVVIVTYDSADLIERCLRSLPMAAGALRIEVVVVDNASRDDTVARISALGLATVTLLVQDVNLGFAKACNVGVRATTAPTIVLVNPDTDLRPACLSALADALHRHPDAGLVGGRTLTPDGGLDPRSCWGLPSVWSSICFASGLSTLFRRSAVFNPESLGDWQRDTDREVGVVTGCLLACPRQFWDELEGFDETYFVYGEDVDLSYRARQAGRHPRITPLAEAVHVVGASSALSLTRSEMILRGKVTFFRRRWGPLRGRLGITMLVVGVGLRAVLGRVRRQREHRELWSCRQEWLRGWPTSANSGDDPSVPAQRGARPGSSSSPSRVVDLARPRTWKHLARLLNFARYDAAELAHVRRGSGATVSPHVSIRNGRMIEIGDGVHVGQGSSLWAGEADGRIVLGSRALLAPRVFITASNYDFAGRPGPVMDAPRREADVHIGADTWLGVGVTVLPGVTIGDGSVVAAGSVVTHDLPPRCLAAGVPAEPIRLEVRGGPAGP